MSSFQLVEAIVQVFVVFMLLVSAGHRNLLLRGVVVRLPRPPELVAYNEISCFRSAF